MTIRYSSEPITHLAPNEVFVFDSNLAGRHGKGAALQAMQFGAVYGFGWGHMGQTYAIPTKDSQLRTLPIRGIRVHVDTFIAYAIRRDDLTFRLTKIGCGLAGYAEEQIAPLFAHAPPNVIRPEGW